ncbi:uncharacterized protein LOC127857026 isoform X1 [Dreissena polymorpha]|uniref:Uncharacterized protein n=1 Tax=Dreissena polymorpha TaxID=45954 RepID=A0A9D3Z2U0_DREPO|nr:uncharacterized protein LOC127857026 isoform X1 [Dreissena polymorpha]KAH3709169.1 hypothetical protein DPMN_068631 [Dreissena polymorpha]
MVGAKTFVLACALAVLLCVSNVDAAFKCYDCIGTSSSDSCSDEFTKSSSLESSSANCEACTKTKLSGVVTRGCSPVAIGNDCTTSGDDASCTCNSELCNGSNNMAVSMATLLGATLVVFFSNI